MEKGATRCANGAEGTLTFGTYCYPWINLDIIILQQQIDIIHILDVILIIFWMNFSCQIKFDTESKMHLLIKGRQTPSSRRWNHPAWLGRWSRDNYHQISIEMFIFIARYALITAGEWHHYFIIVPMDGTIT